MQTKKCEYCGKEFQPRQFNQKYCSRQCSKKASYEKEKSEKQPIPIRECIVCGTKFQPKTKTQTICDNPECKKERNRQKCKEFHKNGKSEIIEKECIICGEKFKTNNSWQNLCGKEECKKERASREKRGIPESEYSKMIGVYTYGIKEQIRTCPICNREFVTKSSNQIYCSEECKHKKVCLDRPNNLSKSRICAECGCEFIPTSSMQKYCQECSVVVEKRRQKEYNDNKPRKDYEPTPCLYCGELFKPKQYNQKYCCKEHQELHYKETEYNKIRNKIHYQNNKERYKQQHKEYYESHKEETRERVKRNRNLRQKNDPDYVLKRRVREQIRDNLNRYNLKKNFHTFELLGYTTEDLHNHLESLFEQNSDERGLMSWGNIGEVWHIDHIKPCSSFIFINEDGTTNEDAIKECWKLENLQPMYKEDNIEKSSWFEGNYYVKGKIISTENIEKKV